jgi:hypothetical protein
MRYDSSLRNQNTSLVSPRISGAHGGALPMSSHARAPRWSSANRAVAVHELPPHVKAAGQFDAAPRAQDLLAQPRRASGREETTVRFPESSTLYDQVLTFTPHSTYLGPLPDAGLADLALREGPCTPTHEHGATSLDACKTGVTWEDYCLLPFAALHRQSSTAPGTAANRM